MAQACFVFAEIWATEHCHHGEHPLSAAGQSNSTSFQLCPAITCVQTSSQSAHCHQLGSFYLNTFEHLRAQLHVLTVVLGARKSHSGHQGLLVFLLGSLRTQAGRASARRAEADKAQRVGPASLQRLPAAPGSTAMCRSGLNAFRAPSLGFRS